jgi:hypothetical protein
VRAATATAAATRCRRATAAAAARHPVLERKLGLAPRGHDSPACQPAVELVEELIVADSDGRDALGLRPEKEDLRVGQVDVPFFSGGIDLAVAAYNLRGGLLDERHPFPVTVARVLGLLDEKASILFDVAYDDGSPAPRASVASIPRQSTA